MHSKPEVQQAVRWSVAIENSGQCTAMRHLVAPQCTTESVDAMLSEEQGAADVDVPMINSSADSLRVVRVVLFVMVVFFWSFFLRVCFGGFAQNTRRHIRTCTHGHAYKHAQTQTHAHARSQAPTRAHTLARTQPYAMC